MSRNDPLCKRSERQVSLIVIEDVISQARDLFREENVHEKVLVKLKNMWKAKLGFPTPTSNLNVEKQESKNLPEPSMHVQTFQQQPPNNHVQLLTNQVAFFIPEGMFPLTIPVYIFQNDPVQNVLTTPTIHMMNHPKTIADNTLEHVNGSFGQPQVLTRKDNSLNHSNEFLNFGNLASARKRSPSTNKLMLDSLKCSNKALGSGKFGAARKPSSPKEKLMLDSLKHCNKGLISGKLAAARKPKLMLDQNTRKFADAVVPSKGKVRDSDSESLNSGDDDEDTDAVIEETDNLIVCRYEKVTINHQHVTKIWLKDGVMHLGGKDYVFKKAHGHVQF